MGKKRDKKSSKGKYHCSLDDDPLLMAVTRTFGQVLSLGQGTRLSGSFSFQAHSAQQEIRIPRKGPCTDRSVCCSRWLVSVIDKIEKPRSIDLMWVSNRLQVATKYMPTSSLIIGKKQVEIAKVCVY